MQIFMCHSNNAAFKTSVFTFFQAVFIPKKIYIASYNLTCGDKMEDIIFEINS